MTNPLRGYEWDYAKGQENLAKHRIDFAIVAGFQWLTAVIEPSPRSGEMRFIARGYIDGRLYTVVYTWRGYNRRIISLRKANPREETRYAQIRAQA